MSQQPIWKCIANLGDTNPIEYGGYFVFEDQTGVYPPEAEVLIEPSDDDIRRHEDNPQYIAGQLEWTVYRFILEPCTYQNGILSDNEFHPDKSAWFAKTEEERKERPQDNTYLKNISNQFDESVEEFAKKFTSEDVLDRAWAWKEVGIYHGFDELDHYPLTLNRKEVWGRYNSRIRMLNKAN